nr:hypothetical protein Itr_chr12CG28940 [Ipomoea trifida]
MGKNMLLYLYGTRFVYHEPCRDENGYDLSFLYCHIIQVSCLSSSRTGPHSLSL